MDRLGKMAMLLLLVAGCGEKSQDRCASVVCNSPPEDSCADDHTLLQYQASGSCDHQTGLCTYLHIEFHCVHGCRDGACLTEDKCYHVVCDQPPDNYCEDDQALRAYDTTGTCDPDDGTCEYGYHQQHCEHGCVQASCQNQDLCQGVTCDDPPADTCLDEETLVEYQPQGTCQPDTGSCEYPSQERPCPNGCQQGMCIGDDRVWGWIRVVEWNDTHSNAPFRNDQGAQAFFATEARCRWSMEHRHPDNCRVVDQLSSGSCQLAIVDGLSAWHCEPAGVVCDYMTQECILDGDTYACGHLPDSWDAGNINVEGLKVEVVMERQPDYDNEYTDMGLPGDLFDAGDQITAATTGGDLQPFSLQATGVAPLTIPDSQITLVRNMSTLVSWEPADPQSRVRVVLSAGSHPPHEYFGTVICEASDGDGQLEIPAEIVNAFLDYAATIGVRRNSHVMRFTRTLDSPFTGEIEMLVGSARNLQLILK